MALKQYDNMLPKYLDLKFSSSVLQPLVWEASVQCLQKEHFSALFYTIMCSIPSRTKDRPNLIVSELA